MDIFEEVKGKVDIQTVVEYFGVSIDRNGKGLCPFHKEKTPSFSIDKKNNIFKCFGCGEGGDVINFVAKLKNISQRDAAQLLNIEFNLGLDIVNKSTHIQKKSPAEKKREIEAKRLKSYREWVNNTYDKLCKINKTICAWKFEYSPSVDEKKINVKYLFAINNINLVEFLLDEIYLRDTYDYKNANYDRDKELTYMINEIKENINGKL